MKRDAKHYLTPRIHSTGVLLLFLSCMVSAGALEPRSPERTALDDYVDTPDPNYSFSLVRKLARSGYTEYHLDMISQKWREKPDEAIWEHRVTVVVPDTVSSSVALMGIVDGDNGQDRSALPFEREWAVNTNTVVAAVHQVPNQPLVFTGEQRSRSEDEILAYTFARYLDTGDEIWPAMLPMVKSVVRAMDTVQTFVAPPATSRSTSSSSPGPPSAPGPAG